MKAQGFFWDRDGVINELVDVKKTRGPRDVSELRFSPGAAAFSKKLNLLGYIQFVLTNQPDVSRGHQSMSDLEAIHRRVEEEFPHVIKIYCCIHDNEEGCTCRKPKTGMLEQAFLEYEIDSRRSFMIGDRWTDILTAKNFGISSILLESSSSWDGSSQGHPPADLAPDYRIRELDEILNFLP
jgi:D-glycero-D-manno-heptose 1,7-bisphosphate phosphatase